MNWYAVVIFLMAICIIVAILLGAFISHGMGSHIDNQRMDDDRQS